MQVGLSYQLGPQVSKEQMFSGLPPQRSLWPSFFTSTCGHFLIVWLAFSYLQFLTTKSPDLARARPRMRVLDLNFQTPRAAMSHFTPSPAPQRASSGPGKAGPPRQSLTSAAEPPQTASESSSTEAPREFKLPPVAPRNAASETLVQLDVPEAADVHHELHVPKLILLSEARQNVPPKPFVAPPDRRKTAEVPRALVLEMQLPVLEIQAGRTKTPEFLAKTPPLLPAPAGAVSPVSAQHAPVSSKAAGTIASDSLADSVNVISLPNRPIPPASSIVLPPVNQVSPRDAGGSGIPGARAVGNGATDARGSDDSAAHGAGVMRSELRPGPDAQAGRPTGSGGAKNTGSGQGSGSQTQANAAGNGDHPGVAVETGTGVSAGAGSDSGSGNSLARSGSGESPDGGPGRLTVPRVDQVIRILHPRDARYEVAVVQSSGAVPGSAGLLQGRPVYSVYVSVGPGKEWILQYCIPSVANAGRSQVVQLGPLTAVSAPYAYSMIRPALHFRSPGGYAFIHGVVSAAGKFEELKQVGEAVIENVPAVLESLQQWEFRPAVKDGAPVAVEILLCIPYQPS